MARKKAKDRTIGLVVLLIVIFIAVFGFVLLYRTTTTGRYVNPHVPKQYVFGDVEIRDERLLYCPEGLYPEMKSKSLAAQINSGRKCVPSPYTEEFPYLDDYYCCAPVFNDRYIEELPRHPY
ncbi:hypothetical protein GF358_02065 [Candidatus Woesearchaeota archaeon]|nr:hypothetical protein [Candidatus Woesearchaeota archaeon]